MVLNFFRRLLDLTWILNLARAQYLTGESLEDVWACIASLHKCSAHIQPSLELKTQPSGLYYKSFTIVMTV
jgi:hypothetical protein